MSVDVKIGDDILYGASVVRLESATTPGTYEEFTLGGGGYPESVIANDTVTLDENPVPITFVPGADQHTISAWKVKVNDIELEYISEDYAHLKEVDGITYVVSAWDGDILLGVWDEDEEMVPGTYTVNIVSPPTMHISANGQVNVSDVAAVSVDVQPHFNSRVETIELDSGSTVSSISLDFLTVTDYNEVVNPSIQTVVSRGESETITVYDDSMGNAAHVLIRSIVPMTSISGRNVSVSFSTDKTWAYVLFRGSGSDYVVVT